MERYEALELEVIRFDTEDVITTSGEQSEDYIPGGINLPEL